MSEVPRGVEVLLKKAAVDLEFRKLLLEQRAEAARTIDLELTEAECQMLAHIPTDQLETITRNTKVKPEHRAIFLDSVGKLMVAARIAQESNRAIWRRVPSDHPTPDDPVGYPARGPIDGMLRPDVAARIWR